MEIEELVDRYKQAPPKFRYAMIFALSLIPAGYYWMEEGETLQRSHSEIRDQVDVAQARLENNRRRVADLPMLLSRIREIEDDLEKARKILPDRVEIDQVLATLGYFEKDLQVELMKFVPGMEVQPNAEIEYKELPVDLTLRGTFPQIMRFYDRVLRMPNLTHLRAIQFDAMEDGDGSNESRNSTIVESTSKLILFKGL